MSLFMADWNPEHYLAFADERARPCIDLLLRIPLQRPRIVYDLGCGPGNSTAVLKQAYPHARIVGIDRSPAMIAKAKQTVADVDFRSLDVTLWQTDREADLVFSNALFQWVPQHGGLLQRIVHSMKKGAVLAVQVPDNLYEPSHIAMSDTAKQESWAHKLTRAGETREEILLPQDYYDLLRPLCSQFEIWHTLYQHAVDGYDGIAEMLSSSGLRPYLDALDPDEQRHFLVAYKEKLAEQYPIQADGKVLFRFPRLFILARK
jgi:trans-aconitate 2-methyltransferase